MEGLVLEGDVRRGGRFQAACRLAARVWPVNPKRVRAREAALRLRWASLGDELHSARRDAFVTPTEGERDVASRKIASLQRAQERAGRAIEQSDFHRALEDTRLDVSLNEVLRFAALAAVATALLGCVSLGMAIASKAPAALLAPIVALAAVAPVAAYVGVASYPEALARRLRIESMGSTPEAVNYMAMSMRVVPALDRAVEFAAHHTEEPLASRLRRILWGVYLRNPPGVESAFLRFAGEWGDLHADVKRSFFTLGSAAAEQTEGGLDRALEKAREIAFEGTKARIQEYASGLRGPTTVLFTLGVLLPLLIGAMLPLLSIGGIAPSVSAGDRPPSGPDLAVPTVIAMDLLFPLGAFAYAYRILGLRPGTGAPVEATVSRSRGSGIIAAAVLAAAGIAFAMARSPAAMLVPLWGIVVAVAVWLLPGLRGSETRRRDTASLEAEFPDALFILGSRIAEGAPAETALRLTAEATRGTEVAALLDRIVRRLQTSRAGLEEVLFAPRGVFADVPSRTVRAAFRMIVEVSQKDSATAGKAIVQTSTYLRDLREVDRQIRRDLSSTVDAMQSTATFFAPLVLGVTCALYGLLARSFSRLVVLSLSPETFLVVVGLYLLLTAAVITFFRVGIANGRDPVGVRSQLVRNLPVAMAVFTAAFLVAEAGLTT